MSRAPRPLLLALIALLGAPPARAQVSFPVDDFEVLGFDVFRTGPGSASDLQFAAPSQIGGHIISPTRQVTCSVGLGGPEETTSARLYAGTVYNDALRATVSGSGSVALLYDLGYSADLTAAGAVDRIELGLGAADFANVRVALVDENDDAALLDVPNPPMNAPTFPLAAFTGVDLGSIRQIIVVLTDPGIYDLFSIRLCGEGSTGVDFEIHDGETVTPSLPTPPVTATLYEHPLVQPLHDLAVSIVEADAGFTPELYLTLDEASSFAGGEQVHLELSWTDDAPFEPVQLAFSVDVAAAGALLPMLYPPDPIHGPEGIALPFTTMLQQPGGAAAGASETWLTIDPGPLQAPDAMTFENVLVTPNPAAAGGGMTGFTVSFLLVPGAPGVETIWPLLEMTWWSDWTPASATAAPVAASRDAGPRLVAAPSVTRGGAEIRAARPFEAGARLLVHDVRGRRIAELAAAAGARSVRWEGRGRDGRPVPAGVYFVHVAGRRDEGTRVVTLR